MGDAGGIGPEIIVKACLAGAMADAIVVGDVSVMRRAIQQLGVTLAVAQLEHCFPWPHLPAGMLAVWQAPACPPGLAALPQGQILPTLGRAAAVCVRAAVAQMVAGEADALVTAPLHKEALAAAGEDFPGHTELLQALAGAPAVRMMLANDELRVVLTTVHVSLRRALEMITMERVFETIALTHESAATWGVPAPRMAVAGLNPHAGEGGRFGDEESRIIGPAVEAARRLGMNVVGPIAPDTVFMRARRAPGAPGEFDVVIAMYHDQGLIPVKYLGLAHGVNVTLGLPFVRTSPDHGTAFDLAGRGEADPSSLIAALSMAQDLVKSRSP